jgi:hypothetical protein
MGGNWYNRSKEGMFEVPKPLSTLGIGIDALPKELAQSVIFTGNDLGMLANIGALPKEAKSFVNTSEEIHKLAQQRLIGGDVPGAWRLLLNQV